MFAVESRECSDRGDDARRGAAGEEVVGYVVRMILEQRQASLDTTITDDKIRYRRGSLLVWGSGSENGCLSESLLQLLLRAGFVHNGERTAREAACRDCRAHFVGTAGLELRTSHGLLSTSPT